MRAVVLDRFGGPEVLTVTQRPVPTPGPGQLLVAVTACGVCGHDLLARKGALATSLPTVLGHEIAGVVAATGEGVDGPAEGQRVALIQRMSCGDCQYCRRGATNLCRRGPGFYGEDLPGGYADYVIAAPGNTVVIPETVSDEQAAILSCGVGTGYRALRSAELSEGDLVVVTGAGGGVGRHTVELAVLSGARVLAVTSSPDKQDALQAAGACAVSVSPSPAGLRSLAKDLSNGVGAQAAIEITGTPTFQASFAALAPGGRLVLVGNTRPEQVAINPGAVIVRELKILGSAHATRSDVVEVVALVDQGKLVPSVGMVAPLTEVVRVHRAMEERAVLGRAVLMVGAVR